MASISYGFVSNCVGGGHTTIAVSFNGGATQSIVYGTDELRAPLGALSQEDREALALNILKVHFTGMTRAQMRSALQAGVTVTL
jgi:hypothetical protein